MLTTSGLPLAAREPLGDFGRAPYRHVDAPYPTARDLRETSRRPSVILTDEEQEMLDRFWRFLRMPDGHQWDDGGPDRPSARHTAPQGNWAGPVDRYFRWLKATEFRSSHTRFNALADAIEADLGTLPSTFQAICVVLELDERRAIALAGLDVDRKTAIGVELRRRENRGAIGWFAAALAFRSASYTYALDHLLVESPHEEARDADLALIELGSWTAGAARGDYCYGDALVHADGGRSPIPGRVLMGDHEEIVQK